MPKIYDPTWLDRSRTLLSRLPIKNRQTHAMTQFTFFPSQERRLQKMREQWRREGHIRIIDLKARRVGFSSQTTGLLWCRGLGFPNMNMKIVAHLAPSAEELFRVPSDLSRGFPQFPLEDIQQKKIYFRHSNGDSHLTIATAGTPAAGRGGTLSGLLLSEAAKYYDPEIFVAMISSVSKGPGSIVVIESTANGREGPGEAFYEYWNEAVAGKNGYIANFASWLEDPDFIRPEEEAEDAPRDDLEKELMAPPFNATREQIAWMRRTKAEDCRNVETAFLTDFPHCLSGNTRVQTSRGIIYLSELKLDDRVSGKNIIGVFHEGEQPTKRITFNSGREIDVTDEHLFPLLSGKLTRVSDLKVGDTIPLSILDFAPSYYLVQWEDFGGVKCHLVIDEDWGRFLGYFMGDGSYHGAQVSICCTRKDDDVVEDVERLFDKILGGHQTRNPSVGSTEIRVSRPAFLGLMEKLGIRATGLDKRGDRLPMRKVCVPECIWRSPRIVVREFIRSLFEADGWNAWEGHSIKFYSQYRSFVQEVQLLLLGFGVTSTIKRASTRREGKVFEGWWLYLRASESLRYHQDIGFIGKRKNVCAPYKHLGRKSLPIILADTISTIESVGLREVYDVRLTGDNLFNANGLITHNCPEVAFQISGDPALPREELAYCEKTIRPPIARGKFYRPSPHAKIEFHKDDNGPVFLWKYPVNENNKPDGLHYFIGADAALGTEEGDFTAYCCLCGETGELACRFAERVPPEILAEQLNMCGNFYNLAMVNIELTGNLGRWALKVLRDTYRYSNIYTWKGRDDRRRGKTRSISLGFEMNQATRRLIVDAARSGIRMGMNFQPGGLVLNDRALMGQIGGMTIKEWRWEIKRDHDDIAVAWMIACLTREQYPPPRMKFAPKNIMDPQNPKEMLAGIPIKEEISGMIRREMTMFMKAAKTKHRDRLVGV